MSIISGPFRSNFWIRFIIIIIIITIIEKKLSDNIEYASYTIGHGEVFRMLPCAINIQGREEPG